MKEKERRREEPLRCCFDACLMLWFAGFRWERLTFEKGLIVVLLCCRKIVWRLE
jgi:hypothetical protein